LPDPFLMPRGKGMVITPRPGVAAVVELAIAPTGEVEGLLTGPENTPMAGVGLELVDMHGAIIARTMTEYDGFFLFDRVAYGRYGLRLTDESAGALSLPRELSASVELGPARPIERLGTIRLRAASTLAQARAPPISGDP
jgi:hypothetical protein